MHETSIPRTPRKEGKRRAFPALIIIVLAGAAVVVAGMYYNGSSTSLPASIIGHDVSQHSGQLPASVFIPRPVDDPSTHGSIRQDISILNDNNALPFDTDFRQGEVFPFKPGRFLTRTDTSFIADLKTGSILTTPAIANGLMYVPGGFSSRAFYCLSSSTGSLLWAASISDDGPSSPLVTDSSVIFNTESCTLFALNRFTGKQLWSKWLGDPLLAHPATDGKYVYTTYPSAPGETLRGGKRPTHLLPSHAFAAFSATTGEIKWQRWLNGDIMTTPVLEGDAIYLVTFTGTLYKLSQADGRILNARMIQATSLPTIVGDKIYIAQRKKMDGKVYEAIVELRKNDLHLTRTLIAHEAPYLDHARQEKTAFKEMCDKMDEMNGFVDMPGSVRGTEAKALLGLSNVSSLQSFVGSTIVPYNNRLYSCFGNEIICLDAASGATLWSYPLPATALTMGGHAATIPVVVGPSLITVTTSGEVLLLDPISGGLQRTYSLNTNVRNQPLAYKGRIYVPTIKGQLIALDTKNPALTGCTMFLGNNAHHLGK